MTDRILSEVPTKLLKVGRYPLFYTTSCTLFLILKTSLTYLLKIGPIYLLKTETRQTIQ